MATMSFLVFGNHLISDVSEKLFFLFANFLNIFHLNMKINALQSNKHSYKGKKRRKCKIQNVKSGD